MKTTRCRWLSFSVLVVVLGGLAHGVARAQSDWDWNYNLILGHRHADPDWAPFRTYKEVGVEAAWGKADEPLLIATDVYASQATKRVFGFEIESNTWEFNPGLRKIWTIKKRWHPYGGAGFGIMQASMQRANTKREFRDRDRTYGVWIGGGLFFRAGSHLNLGMAARLSAMRDFKVFDEPRNGISTHLAVTIGWGATTPAPEK